MTLKPWFLPASLITITFLCFFNALWHPFVHDDIFFIVQNPKIAQLDHLDLLFLKSSYAHVTAGINAYYRPILEIVYRLEYRMFGLFAPGYHLVNICIHVANGVLLFFLLLRLSFSRAVCFAIALLFLIHPLQSESVACISGISNLLMAFFVLGTLNAYLNSQWILSFIGLALALCTKEGAVMLPALMVLADYFQGRKSPWLRWAAVFGITLAFLWFRTAVTGSHLLDDLWQSPGEFKLRLLSIPRTILMYLGTIFFPVDLHYYRNTDILQPNGIAFLVFAFLLALVCFVIYRFKEIRGELVFGLGWFLVCLAPVLNIIPLINEYSFILTAEHFLYLPLIGLIIAIISLSRVLLSRRVLMAGAVILAIGLGLLTILQNQYWRGEIPLFERVVYFERNFARGHILLARAYMDHDQTALARPHFLRALEIMQEYHHKASNPQAKAFYLGFIKEIHEGLGQAFLRENQLDQATDHYFQALKLAPQDVSILNNLAVCYLRKGDPFQAEQYLKMALGFNPNYTPARNNLAALMKDN